MVDSIEKEVRDYLNGKSRHSAESIYRLVYKTYASRLYSFIASILKNREDAEDVAQNVWIKVFRNLKSFKGESTLYTWIYRIGYNECMNWKNSREYKKYTPIESTNIFEGWDDPTKIDAETAFQWLNDAIQTLPPRQKAVFTLRYFEELSYEKISEITGITEGALKASYHHALEKVENYLLKKLNDNKFH